MQEKGIYHGYCKYINLVLTVGRRQDETILTSTLLHFSENLHCTYVILHFRIVQYEYTVICTGPGIKQEMLQWYLPRSVAQRHPLPFGGIWKQEAIPNKKLFNQQIHQKALLSCHTLRNSCSMLLGKFYKE